MAIRLFWYSGTGNSLAVARSLADALGGAELISMRGNGEAAGAAESAAGEEAAGAAGDRSTAPGAGDTIGIIFPVHMWGPPPGVKAYIEERLPADGGYYFAVAVNTGGVANALKVTQRILGRRGVGLDAGFSVLMPNVYLPFGAVPAEEERKRMYVTAEERVGEITAIVSAKKAAEIERGPRWQRIVFGGMHHMVVRQVPKLDKPFSADENCTSCGVCVKVCPARNISLEDGVPVWHHRCELCFSCIHWCPEDAIQYGKGTVGKDRYHHPSVSLADMTID